MAAKKKKNARKQPDLPEMKGAGVSQVQIPEVDSAAADYVRVRDRRMDLTKKEVEAKDKLITILKAHKDQIGVGEDGSLRYVFDELQVELTPTGEQLKVKAYVDPGAPE